MPIFERNSILYLQDVYDHIVRITDSIDTYRDLLSSALDAFLSVQSNRLNQIVKVLTIASIGWFSSRVDDSSSLSDASTIVRNRG